METNVVLILNIITLIVISLTAILMVLNSRRSSERERTDLSVIAESVKETSEKMNGLEVTNLRMQMELKDALNEKLLAINDSNERRLDEIKEIVNDKLSDTLNKNLNESFKTVSDQLSVLYTSLGEMREMNNDVTRNVTQLNKIMSNVKSRGTWAEVQLGNILDETIPGMYERNFKPNPESAAVVEFAIKMPTQSGNNIYLPVDSKLPMEDYARLVAAQDAGDVVAMEVARKALEARVLSEAKDVSKYISVPLTTPYAILYLATEGLYAEILSSKNGVYEKIQAMGIMVAGPNTITAILTSLAMGYRAMAVNSKADEISKLLSVTRAQYVKFADSLSKVRKSLDSASASLDQAEKRNEIMTKKLRSVDVLDQNDQDILAIDNSMSN